MLGYGEISTVFAIEVDGLRDLAFKRLPIFRAQEEMAAYGVAYEEYNRLLREEVGLHLLHSRQACLYTDTGRPVFYIIQKTAFWIPMGHRALHLLSHDGILTLVRCVLRECVRFGPSTGDRIACRWALMGGICNWSIESFDPRDPRLSPDAVLQYVDTSTPRFRAQGVDELDPGSCFCASAPSFLAWLLRALVSGRRCEPLL